MESRVKALVIQSCEMPIKSGEIEPGLTTDNASFMPFMLIDGNCRALAQESTRSLSYQSRSTS